MMEELRQGRKSFITTVKDCDYFILKIADVSIYLKEQILRLYTLQVPSALFY